MKRFSLAILGWLIILGSAQAGPLRGTEVPTKLLPLPVQVIPEPVPVVVYEVSQLPPAPPEKKCRWVKTTETTYHPSADYYVAPMLVQACHSQVWMPGTFYSSSGQAVTAVAIEKVCDQ